MFGLQYYAKSMGKMTITHSLSEKLAASQSIIVIDQLNSTCKINLVSNKPQAIVQTFFKKEKHLKNFKNLARSLISHIPIYICQQKPITTSLDSAFKQSHSRY
jgi:hypothetical protein